MPPKRKRAASGGKKQAPPAKRGTKGKPIATGKAKSAGKPIVAGVSRAAAVVIKADPDEATTTTTPAPSNTDQQKLRERFIALFQNDDSEVSNASLKETFGDEYLQLVPIINELIRESRLSMSKVGEELYYTLVNDETAAKFAGLDISHQLVYQIIEKAGNLGIWTREIRTQTSIQQQALNKIFKVQSISSSYRSFVVLCGTWLSLSYLFMSFFSLIFSLSFILGTGEPPTH